MKANEAPEKIYLQPLENNEIYNHWYTLKLNNDFIEYTRTETFLEDACKFLFENYHGEKLSLRMIDEFRNHMKG